MTKSSPKRTECMNKTGIIECKNTTQTSVRKLAMRSQANLEKNIFRHDGTSNTAKLLLEDIDTKKLK